MGKKVRTTLGKLCPLCPGVGTEITIKTCLMRHVDRTSLRLVEVYGANGVELRGAAWSYMELRGAAWSSDNQDSFGRSP